MVILLLIVLLVLAVVSLLAHYHHAAELNKLRGEFDSLMRWVGDKLHVTETPKP